MHFGEEEQVILSPAVQAEKHELCADTITKNKEEEMFSLCG